MTASGPTPAPPELPPLPATLGDRRLTPANGRVADLRLRGLLAADRFVAPAWQRVAAPLADLRAAPAGARDRQLLHGERFGVLERRDGWAFGFEARDGYVGWVRTEALGADAAPTHWVAARATHLYPAPDLKREPELALSFGALLRVEGDAGRFLALADGRFAPAPHLRALGDWLSDPVVGALVLLGAPYLWGGNTAEGIDCSGLVQAGFRAAGRRCPGDSDLQAAAVGRALPEGRAPRRGDLLAWPGHVALAAGRGRLVHANALHMAVVLEPLADALARMGPPRLRRPGPAR